MASRQNGHSTVTVLVVEVLLTHGCTNGWIQAAGGDKTLTGAFQTSPDWGNGSWGKFHPAKGFPGRGKSDGMDQMLLFLLHFLLLCACMDFSSSCAAAATRNHCVRLRASRICTWFCTHRIIFGVAWKKKYKATTVCAHLFTFFAATKHHYYVIIASKRPSSLSFCSAGKDP